MSALINHPGERPSTVSRACQGPPARSTPTDFPKKSLVLWPSGGRGITVCFNPQREDIGRMSPELHQIKSTLRRYQIMIELAEDTEFPLNDWRFRHVPCSNKCLSFFNQITNWSLFFFFFFQLINRTAPGWMVWRWMEAAKCKVCANQHKKVY